VTDDDDDDVDDEYYPGKFTYKQYDVSHKSNTSLYSEDHLRLRAIGSSENLDVIAITNRGKKEVMLIFDKQQVTDLITALTYWRDYVCGKV
jgi:hypothetical protein